MDNIIIIHPRDNVGIALKTIADGTPVIAGGRELLSSLDEIPVSHKVALCHIDTGEEIIKYGEPVAVTSKAIEKGQWVHTHNLESKMWQK